MVAVRQIDCGISRHHNPLEFSRPSRSAPVGSILDLRRLLAERFPHPPAPTRTHLNTGLDLLDRTLGGGLPKSAITELISPEPSAGSATLIQRLLQTAERERYFVALIDGCDSFDPQSLEQTGLRHLLWARCTKALEAIKAADLLLRDGNFLLVIVDLILNPAKELRKIPQTSWYRLQRLVENTSSACLVLNRPGLVSSAQIKIVLENLWTLESLDNGNALEQLRFRIQRSHLRSQVTGHLI